jgi:hypothetical protein
MSDAKEPLELHEDSPPADVAAKIGELYAEVVQKMVEEAPAVAKLEAKIEATRIVRRWYLMAVLAAAIVSLAVSAMALNIILSTRTQQAAWHAVFEARQQNFTSDKQKLAMLNDTLKAEGKAQVPEPQTPLDATAAVSLATVLLRNGPVCPDGSTVQKVTYSSGVSGWGCVNVPPKR